MVERQAWLGKEMGAKKGQGLTKRAVQVVWCVSSRVPCGVELPQPVGLVQKPRGPVLCAHCNSAGMHKTCVAEGPWDHVYTSVNAPLTPPFHTAKVTKPCGMAKARTDRLPRWTRSRELE